MSTQLETIIKNYRRLAQVPALLGARISNLKVIVNSVWSQRDLERGKTTKFLQSYVLNPELQNVTTIAPLDISNELLSSYASSGNFRAVIRDVSEGKEKKQSLEIWKRTNKQNSVDLAALDVHGDVYSDGEFGSLEFSPNEKKVVYVAEKKQPKTEAFYKRQPAKQQPTVSGDNGSPVKGEEYTYRQDWGEQLVGKKESVVVVYDLEEDSVKVLEGIPPGYCPGQVVWSPDGSYVAGVALKTEPRKLGLMFCTNRDSAVFTLDLNGKYVEVSVPGKAVKAPRFTPDGKYLIWLQRNVGGPHHACMELVRLQLPFDEGAKPETVVGVVDKKITIADGSDFYGLYNTDFPTRCWANDGKRLVLSTNQLNVVSTFLVNVETGEIQKIPFDSGNLIALDVHNGVILTSQRNFLIPDVLAIANLPENISKDTPLAWTELSTPQEIPPLKNKIYQELVLDHDNNDAVTRFYATYIGPRSGADKAIPLIVFPHGGPHSAFGNNFSLEITLWLTLGFGVLLINFRGSTGQGQAGVDFLLGRVGSADVKDCILATDKCLEQRPWLNPDKLVLVGGSHGGFLVTSISGQYPDKYKAVIARNPVIDIASMSITSDIPDWCAVETKAEYTQRGPPDDDLLLKMRLASPIVNAHKVKAPTLLLIGSKDLRVPPSQGIEYHLRLKANGVKTRLNLYDDNHPLGSVSNEMDSVINGAVWMLNHIDL